MVHIRLENTGTILFTYVFIFIFYLFLYVRGNRVYRHGGMFSK